MTTDNDLREALLRAKSIIEHGVEMVGPEPYTFTREEVIEEALIVIKLALAAQFEPTEEVIERMAEAGALYDWDCLFVDMLYYERERWRQIMRVAYAAEHGN